jgi:hypothetical protein
MNSTQVNGCSNITIWLSGSTFSGAENVDIGIQFNGTSVEGLAIYLDGTLGDAPIVDGERKARAGPLWRVVMAANQTVVVYGVQFSNAISTGDGGAIFVEGQSGSSFQLNGATLTNNNAANGGAVAVRGGGGGVAFQFSYFINNTATDAAQSIDDCRFGGGALLLDNSNQSIPLNVEFSDCVFLGNVAAKGCGGGVLLNSVAPGVVFAHNDLSHNTAQAGGAVYALGVSNSKWHGTSLTDNHANGDGGGIYFRQCTHQVLHSVVELNIAKNRGGGFFISNSAITVLNGSFVSNEAVNNGGALSINGPLGKGTDQPVSIADSTFTLNAVTGANGLGKALYCNDTVATFSPPVPQGSSVCDQTCLTPARVCACAECQQVPGPSPSPSSTGSEPGGAGPWPWLAPLLILLVIAIVGGIWWYRRRGESGRAKFLNI